MSKANTELFEALRLLEKEKGIPADYLLEKIEAAVIKAVKQEFGGKDNIRVVLDPETCAFSVAILKTVVEEVEDPDLELLVDQARRYKKTAKVGDTVEIPMETKQFGRIAAGAAKHMIRQSIREAERTKQDQEYQRKNEELVSGVVTHIDPETLAVTLEIANAQVVLSRGEQLESDIFHEGDHVKVYVVRVMRNEKSVHMLISRTHAGFVKRLFENEVPEIYNGTVEIKAISREAGSRTKIAVFAADDNIDPVGACIGPHGSRVNGIVDELRGEKIDIVRYSTDPAAFIAAALSPAKVSDVTVLSEADKACRVSVPENQLSLAIGNKGQNARLAARLTGWKIDIRPESGFYGETAEENA